MQPIFFTKTIAIIKTSEDKEKSFDVSREFEGAGVVETLAFDTLIKDVKECEEEGIMARFLSNTILKGISRASQSPRIVPASFNNVKLRFSTNIPNDPDSHADFQPNNKAVNESGSCSGINIKELVDKDVKEHPIVIYMKGYPDLPQCGFSALAVRVLKQYNVPLTARNILEYPDLRTGVKAYSNWPTFPQIFIKGEFIGGSDIIMNMHQTGELKEKLQDIAGKEESE
uniref:Glutaredoxin family protein n=2 Tax=Populus TaxID=3689 RepID=A0A4U5QW97_POPAL|nr:glutaredoxin family protein [Populus alba]